MTADAQAPGTPKSPAAMLPNMLPNMSDTLVFVVHKEGF